MIKLYRISQTEYINDLTGIGARIYGGRWNNVNHPVVYTSNSRSLAALEFMVHMPLALMPDDLSLAELHVPDSINRETLEIGALPENWRNYPAPERLASIGTNWLKSKSSLLVNVLSAVIDREYNTLINPLHPDMHVVSLVNIEAFLFDNRLFKK